MKTTGIVRKIDELGRIVIPVEIRRIFSINEKDDVEISVENGQIILKKYKETCIFCGKEKNLVQVNKKFVCKKCIESIKQNSL